MQTVMISMCSAQGTVKLENTKEMLIEDKPVNVIIDSGENCNLMSEEMFESIIGVMLSC